MVKTSPPKVAGRAGGGKPNNARERTRTRPWSRGHSRISGGWDIPAARARGVSSYAIELLAEAQELLAERFLARRKSQRVKLGACLRVCTDIRR
jgi:hypothetical protein